MGRSYLGSMKTAAIFDLDGTLCCTKHKKHLVDVNWDEWYDKILLDGVNHWCLDLILRAKKAGFYIILLTARKFAPQVEQDTKLWLEYHDIPYDILIGKDPSDNRPSHVYKKEVYENLKSRHNVRFAVDDEIENAEMWISVGIPCHFCG